METNTAFPGFETDITKLPRTGRARKGGLQPDDCVCCGKRALVSQWVVVTEQGCFPVGPECKAKCIKAGFEVEAA